MVAWTRRPHGAQDGMLPYSRRACQPFLMGKAPQRPALSCDKPKSGAPTLKRFCPAGANSVAPAPPQRPLPKGQGSVTQRITLQAASPCSWGGARVIPGAEGAGRRHCRPLPSSHFPIKKGCLTTLPQNDTRKHRISSTFPFPLRRKRRGGRACMNLKRRQRMSPSRPLCRKSAPLSTHTVCAGRGAHRASLLLLYKPYAMHLRRRAHAQRHPAHADAA